MDRIPSSPEPVARSPRLDPRQQRIADRLSRLIGPGAVSFYSDAAALMGSPNSLASGTHLVAHLLRETQGTILDVLAPPARKQRTLATARLSEADEDGLEEGASYAKRIRVVLATLDIAEASALGASWLGLADRKHEQGLHRWAHRSALDEVRRMGEEFTGLWNKVQYVFDSVLDAFETKFPVMLAQVDGLLAKTPSRSAARQLRSRIPNTPVLRERFFGSAGPDWFEPLLKEAFFAQPSLSPQDGLYRWCQSTYLVRMASVAGMQDRVAEVLGALEPTESFRMHVDLLKAARALPAALAAGWVEREAAWIDRQQELNAFLAGEIAGLVAALATAGECRSAVRLSRALLALKPEHTGGRGSSDFVGRPLYAHYHYEHVVQAITPGLGEKCAWPAFAMGVGLLEVGLQAGERASGRLEDLSELWCRRIGEARARDGDIGAQLVKFIREAARAAITNQPDLLGMICDRLRMGRLPIFRRLELDLLAWCPRPEMERVKSALLERELFLHPSTWPEYRQVLVSYWDKLGPSEQRVILEWIDAGPQETS